MKLKFYLLTSLFLLAGLSSVNAQLSCEYRLEMFDSFGDGWNGASLDVSVDGVVTNYTIPAGGSVNIVDIDVTDGDALTLFYTEGGFPNEVTYFLYDSEDNVVFSDGPFPAQGNVFEGTAACPTCPSVDEDGVTFTQTPGGAVITWDSNGASGTYTVEYGPFGFEPGTGTTGTTDQTTFTIDGFEEGEILDFYITLDCGGGDVSGTTDPIFIQAGYTNPPLECDFQVLLTAGGGFGWNNASLDVTVNGVTTNYTVNFNDNNGDFLLVDIPVAGDALITLDYNPPGFNSNNSFSLISPEGIVLFESAVDPVAGVAYQDVVSCPTCPAVDEETVEITQSPGGFTITWADGGVPGDYTIEYGPFGFEPGTGTTEVVSTNSWTLDGQEEGALFDLYITLDCGDGDFSVTVGNIIAQAGYTNPPTECAYTLQMFDSFGDGWNGSQVEVIINGMSEFYTVDFADNNGDFNIVSIPVVDGALITLVYSPGAFENEVTYSLLDADGIEVFADGPFPTVGESFQGIISCPPCPLPIPTSFVADPIGATTTTLNWSDVAPAVSYTVEFGAGCIEQGEGDEVVTNTNSVELTGLQPSTLYSYFVTGDCGAEGLSNTAGPFFFTTTPECFPPTGQNIFLLDPDAASIEISPDPNTPEYVIEYGPVGFALGGGIPSDPFSGTIGIISDLTPNTTYQYFVYGDCGNAQSEALGPFTFTTPLPCPSAVDIALDAITENTADLSWGGSVEIDAYIIEYGPAGFLPGTGLTLNTMDQNITLTDLNKGTSYDVYVISDCGAEGQGLATGPFNFITDGANSCFYTLELNDSFGDGWNGAFINVVNGDLNADFTVTFNDNNGDFNIVQIPITVGVPLILTYFPGTFENEVTYTLLDSEGNVLLQNGPFPPVGEVYNEIALCGEAGCSIPVAQILDIRGVSALVGWNASDAATEYTVEWGPIGFTLGTGTTAVTTDTTFNITGLEPSTWYNVYVTPNCADPGLEVFSFGALQFQTYLINDVGISGFNSPVVLNACNFESEPISVFIQNYGQNPQQLIPFFYSLNFMNASIENPVDGLFTGVVGKDSMEVIDFDNEVDFSTPGYYYFEAWTELEGDENPSNDTFRYEFISSYPLPLAENFNNITQETGLPTGWSSPQGTPVLQPGDDPHGLLNGAASIELNGFFFNPVDTLEFTTSRYGPVEFNSELTFDYRFVQADFQGNISPYELDADDFFTVAVSTDCGETFEDVFSITQGEDLGVTFFKPVTVDLSSYSGEAINIRFLVRNSGSGQFFADIDNINIAGCPPSMFIQIDQSSPETFANGEGTLFAQPTFGTAPFTFEWSNGEEGAVLNDVGFTSYSVTITDANGCTDERIFTPQLTNTENPTEDFAELTLAPNPTTGETQLQVALPNAADIQVEVYDLSGRLILTQEQDQRSETTFTLNMNNQPNGMYLVRVKADNLVRLVKLAVSK